MTKYCLAKFPTFSGNHTQWHKLSSVIKIQLVGVLRWLLFVQDQPKKKLDLFFSKANYGGGVEYGKNGMGNKMKNVPNVRFPVLTNKFSLNRWWSGVFRLHK